MTSRIHFLSKKVIIPIALLGFIITISFLIFVYLATRDIPPPDVSDLSSEQCAVPPEKNAYTYFVSAIATFHNPTNNYILHKYSNYQAPVDTNLLVAVFQKNLKTFELLKQGAACSVCVQPALLDFNTLSQIPHSDLIGLSNLLAAKARYEHESGHYVEATDPVLTFFTMLILFVKGQPATLRI